MEKSKSPAPVTLAPGSNPVEIPGSRAALAGVLEMPEGGEPKAFALFAHCFTCGKDFLPQKRITRALARSGIATLRFDFGGLGASEGQFAETSFLTNLDDSMAGAAWLEQHYRAPELLVGHSLGGAAVLAVAGKVPGVRAVATIGAPADPAHVTGLFPDQKATILSEGEADVKLAGRSFRVGRKFIEDLESFNHKSLLQGLRGIDVLILHSPLDQVVSIENAAENFALLKHPKSFISLAGADHLLLDAGAADYVAALIEVWARRSLM
jgi:alpha/beta superfamily hydrolase